MVWIIQHYHELLTISGTLSQHALISVPFDIWLQQTFVPNLLAALLIEISANEDTIEPTILINRDAMVSYLTRNAWNHFVDFPQGSDAHCQSPCTMPVYPKPHYT